MSDSTTPWTIQFMEVSRQNTGVGSLSLLQGIFLTQESNQGLLHCRWVLNQLSYQGSPDDRELYSALCNDLYEEKTLKKNGFRDFPGGPACRLSSPTRDQTHVLCIARQTPNCWTTRKVPESILFQSLFLI